MANLNFLEIDMLLAFTFMEKSMLEIRFFEFDMLFLLKNERILLLEL